MHHLDLYEENSVETTFEGCTTLTHLNYILRNWYKAMFYPYRKNVNTGSDTYRRKFNYLNTESITKIITVIIDNCLKLKKMLNNETEIIPCRKLIDIINESMFIATAHIMKLVKRNRPIQGIHTSEESLAKHLLKDLVKKIREVVSEPINFRKPIQHLMIDRHLKAIMSGRDKVFRDSGSYELIIELLIDVVEDLDATDNEQNTLLLTAAKFLDFDGINPCDYWSPVSSAIKVINFLISNGAYIYAKNNKNKTVIDYVADFVQQNERYEDAQRLLERLHSQLPSLQSLAAMKARELSTIGDIPKHTRSFIDLH